MPWLSFRMIAIATHYDGMNFIWYTNNAEAFDGDLDDYHKWLTEQDKNQNETKVVNNTPAAPQSATARKDLKRREAGFPPADPPIAPKAGKT